MPDYSQIPLETNLLRKAFLCSGRPGRTGRDKVDTEVLLGIARASGPVRLIDVEVLGLLINQLRAGESTVRFSKQAICRALYGRLGGGGELRAVSEALDRLTTTQLTFGGYVAERRATVTPIAFWNVRLLEEVRRVDVPSRAGYQAHFQPWLISQLELGYATFVDWETVRGLQGLAKRVFLYVAAQGPSDSWAGRHGYSFLVLGARGLATLGLHDQPPAAAIRSLRVAARKVSDAAPGVDMRVEKNGGQWRLSMWTQSPAKRGRTHLAFSSRRLQSMLRTGPTIVGSQNPLLRSRRSLRASLFTVPGQLSIPQIADFVATTLPDDFSKVLEWERILDKGDDEQRWSGPDVMTVAEGQLCHVDNWSRFVFDDAIEFVALNTHSGFSVHRANCKMLSDVPIGFGAEGTYAVTSTLPAAWQWCLAYGAQTPDPCEVCSRTVLG